MKRLKQGKRYYKEIQHRVTYKVLLWKDFCKAKAVFKSTQINANKIKCWFLRRGENWSTRRKISRCRVENQQTQPTYGAESGCRTRATLVGGECSYHCANTPLQSTLQRCVIRTNQSLTACWFCWFLLQLPLCKADDAVSLACLFLSYAVDVKKKKKTVKNGKLASSHEVK